MKKLLLFFWLSLSSIALYAQCRIIPIKEDAETKTIETFREPAFKKKTKEGNIICGISYGATQLKKDDGYVCFLGITLVTPVSLNFSLNKIAFSSRTTEKDEDFLILEDIEGDAGQAVKGETEKLHTSRKYIVYLTLEELRQLTMMKINGVFVMDKYDKTKIFGDKLMLETFISSLINCVNKEQKL